MRISSSLPLVLILVTAPALAETVVLENGRQLQGKVLRDSGSSLTLEVADGHGTIEIPRSLVADVFEDGKAPRIPEGITPYVAPPRSPKKKVHFAVEGDAPRVSPQATTVVETGKIVIRATPAAVTSENAVAAPLKPSLPKVAAPTLTINTPYDFQVRGEGSKRSLVFATTAEASGGLPDAVAELLDEKLGKVASVKLSIAVEGPRHGCVFRALIGSVALSDVADGVYVVVAKFDAAAGHDELAAGARIRILDGKVESLGAVDSKSLKH